ncbi:hypothetical protein BLNAU_21925 [Blattamonas nauphoetae]|uniref:Uncharacterized protein n=1 Tax=Blattamonas nauphoetae TaxID=2049346 RepID=A0ABQ9WUI3_9EUKA|nr:hypothetical protein BLNAU_21925 [Blattamonas nauphoetae]
MSDSDIFFGRTDKMASGIQSTQEGINGGSDQSHTAAEGFLDSFHKMERVVRRSVPEAYRIVEITHSVVIPTLTAVAWYYCLENRIVLRTHKITITTKLRDCGLHGLGGQIECSALHSLLTIKEQFFHRNTYSEVNGAAEEGTNQCQSDRDLTIAICDTSFGAVLQREERILLNNEDEAAQSLTCVDQWRDSDGDSNSESSSEGNEGFIAEKVGYASSGPYSVRTQAEDILVRINSVTYDLRASSLAASYFPNINPFCGFITLGRGNRPAIVLDGTIFG